MAVQTQRVEVAPLTPVSFTPGELMGELAGRDYARADATRLYFLLFAALLGGGGLFLLIDTGRTSGWFFILAGLYAVGALRSRRRPYAVVNARGLTLWLSPLRSRTLPWSSVVSARRVGVRVRLELSDGRPVDVRWDSVPSPVREQFVAEFASHLGPRWTAGEHERTLAQDVRTAAWLQVGLLVILILVGAALITLLIRTGQIAMPLMSP